MKELVEKMLDTWFARRYPQSGGGWRKYSSTDRSTWVAEMSAVMHVAADAMLGPVTDSEVSVHCSGAHCKDTINALIASRRARLTAPAKTPEERVTVYPNPAHPRICDVFLDGELQITTTLHFAAIFRLGLLATLNQERPL